MALVGYARVNTLDQDPALQLDALAAAGCAKVFEERASGARADRPGMRQALDYVREGDVLVVWKLDRLGRSHIGGSASARLPRQSTPRRREGGWCSTCSVRSGSSSAI